MPAYQIQQGPKVKTIDIDECADFLKVDRTVALRLAGTGALPGAKIGRAWVFLLDDLVEYLRAQVRIQARERQARADVNEELEASAVRNPSMTTPMRGAVGRPRKVHPDLSTYDNLSIAAGLPKFGG